MINEVWKILGICVIGSAVSIILKQKSAEFSFGVAVVTLKAVGIAYITDFVADACRDAGLASVASKAELVGKSAIFLLSVPLIMSVLDTAIGFIK